MVLRCGMMDERLQTPVLHRLLFVCVDHDLLHDLIMSALDAQFEFEVVPVNIVGAAESRQQPACRHLRVNLIAPLPLERDALA
eukprot:CAMPEP_0115880954 /NCGR_PEP_ID=MMETSP0287-20121206/28159_1 /TAXON_ID=412157 /ORGANISM="Chrysochromulina rotalis, Strain UIO044" /LENGTH=82 /DNA_ID=CAMNT_0003336825 /DNA_START=249 /DNA_END=494 /DNA_ORIENTATION=-